MSSVKRKNGEPSPRLLTLREPRLRFRHSQAIEDPKDGLLLFGPPGDAPMGAHYGVIGTPEGIAHLEGWADRIGRAVDADEKVGSSRLFPGFETVFRTPWESNARVKIPIDADELQTTLMNTDPHQRVYNTVELFASQIERWVKEEDEKVALWFVVVPESLWKLCRPRSTIAQEGDGSP